MFVIWIPCYQEHLNKIHFLLELWMQNYVWSDGCCSFRVGSTPRSAKKKQFVSQCWPWGLKWDVGFQTRLPPCPSLQVFLANILSEWPFLSHQFAQQSSRLAFTLILILNLVSPSSLIAGSELCSLASSAIRSCNNDNRFYLDYVFASSSPHRSLNMRNLKQTAAALWQLEILRRSSWTRHQHGASWGRQLEGP